MPSSSRTRPPVDEEGEEVGRANGAVAVEVGGAAFARAPTSQQREEIGRADAAAAVLFHPAKNHVDACPNKLFEYMTARIPVIASDFPQWREMIEGVGCGLVVNPLVPIAIAEAIRWLLTHSEQAEAMGQRGRDAVLSSYRWECEADKLLGIYQTWSAEMRRAA